MREILSQRLRELREATGLSQKELSKKISVSAASIGYYENGDRIPGLDVAAELADFFGVSLDYLAGRSDARTPEAADIIARTGLSGAAVEVLETWHKDPRCEIITKVDILSDIIENSTPPMTFAEYMESAFCLPVFSDTGEDIGILKVSEDKNGFEPECTFWCSGDDREFCFPLADFEFEESLPKNFRYQVIEQYRTYDKLTRYSSSLDILKIMSEFYENAVVEGTKLNYNRLRGVARIDKDMTSVMLHGAEREEAKRFSNYLASICDESLDDVTSIPIAAILDEITSGKLKAAFAQLRNMQNTYCETTKKIRRVLFNIADKAINETADEESTHAKEN
ncbi:MAG: helix-turn-helix transcriptional regulator [Ruminococcaceae bacterium]|nr:helix-turn-helix transcriptional regulator [Oscillospiraceae bacterium]